MNRVYYGWWVLVSSIIIVYLFATVLFGFPAYYASFIESFGWSRAQLLFGNTILQWAYGLSALVWGALVERRGARPVLSLGSGFVAASCLLFGRMHTLWQLYSICFVFGAGLSAMGYLTNQFLQARWFARRRGLAIGLVTSAGGLGGSAAPLFVTFLISRFDWRGAMNIMDVFLWTIPFLLILFVIRERPEEVGIAQGTPAPRALREAQARGKRERDSAKHQAMPAAGIDDRPGSMQSPSAHFREVLKTPVLWVVAGSVFFAAGTIGTTLHLLILYLRDSGFSQQAAAAVLSLEFGFSFIGRLGFGILSDRFSAYKVGIASFALLAASSLLLFGVHIPGIPMAFAVLQGIAHGAIASFFPLVLVEIFGTEKHIGKLLGIGHLAYSGGLGTMPILSAYAFDSTGSFAAGFALNSVMTGVAALALAGIRMRMPENAARELV